MRSNLSNWKEMQDQDYFENHPCYKGLVDLGDFDCVAIEWFTPLKPDMIVVVVGCGYGRETAHIARRVKHVYGIDVSDVILQKAVNYLESKSVTNFTPILAENYASNVPQDIDLVFSIVVMQHLTRDLVRDYFNVLGKKLRLHGKMVIQFLEEFSPYAQPGSDAELRTYEPSVSWSLVQVVELARGAGLKLEVARSYLATATALWHWAFIGKESPQP